MKTDANGVIQWHQTYGNNDYDPFGEDGYYIRSIIQSSDNGFVFIGEAYYSSLGLYENQEGWFVKTDAMGELQWNKTLTEISYIHNLIQTFDDGFILVSEVNSNVTDSDIWLGKTDNAGNLLWNRTFGGYEDDKATEIIQTSDGGFALAGETSFYEAGGADFWLVKTDSNGLVQWNHTYGGTMKDILYSMTFVSDGGFTLVGSSYSYGTDDYRRWLVKTDNMGTMLWSQIYQDYIYDVIQTPDGDLP